MESSISLDNIKLLKVAGIGEACLKKLKEDYGITDHYEIVQQFKTIEDDIWRDGDSQPDSKTKDFIDKLIYIIHDEIKNPELGDDAKNETEKANELVISVEDFIKGKEKSNNKKIGETVEELKRKVGNSELIDTFLCCLLMSDPSKAYLFGGVFKIWGWLQKLDQADGQELKKIFEKENTKEYINRRDRKDQVAQGFQRLKDFINEAENLNLLMDNLDSICQKYEAIIEMFYRWISISGINSLHFSNCYVSVKKHLPNFEQYTFIRNSTNDNLKNHLRWEIEEIQKFLIIPSPSSATQNVDNLQEQLVSLWKQVNDNLNDAKKWKELIIESCKVTTPDTKPNRHSSLEELECLQINLNRSENAWNQLIDHWLNAEKTKNKKPVHVVFIQEPYITKISKNVCCYYFPRLPKNYRVVHNNYFVDKDQESRDSGDYISAILVRDDVPFERIFPTAAIYDNYKYPQELTVGIRLTGQGWDGVTLYSIYCRPIRSLTLVLKPLRSLDNHDRAVLCMDANATHPSWTPDHEDKNLYSGRGEDLEDFRMSCKLKVANDLKKVKDENNQPPTGGAEDSKTGKIPKHIDVTLYGANLCIKKWERLKTDSSSDHRYIIFSIRKSSEESNKSSPLLSKNMSCIRRKATEDLSRGLGQGTYLGLINELSLRLLCLCFAVSLVLLLCILLH